MVDVVVFVEKLVGLLESNAFGGVKVVAATHDSKLNEFGMTPIPHADLFAVLHVLQLVHLSVEALIHFEKDFSRFEDQEVRILRDYQVRYLLLAQIRQLGIGLVWSDYIGELLLKGLLEKPNQRENQLGTNGH